MARIMPGAPSLATSSASGRPRGQRASRQPRPAYKESAYQRSKRQKEWKRNIERCEGHMHRAAYLAANKMAEKSHLVTNDRTNPAWNLWLALWLALAYQPYHDRALCNAAAFEGFIVDTELQQASAEDAAVRWLNKAGYTDAFVLDRSSSPYG
jgi:hypothetical protein